MSLSLSSLLSEAGILILGKAMRTRGNPRKAWGTVLVGIHVSPWSSLEHSLPGMCRHSVTAKHVGGQISELLFCLVLGVPMDPSLPPQASAQVYLGP